MKSSWVYSLVTISITRISGIFANPVVQLDRRTSQQAYTFDQISSTADLKWYPCYNTYHCARLTVPLDYHNTQLTNASVPLIKLSAEVSSKNGAYKGAILVNPGGPGLSGIDTILTIGHQVQQNITGTNYDLISFDPRGVGRSIPSATCAPADTSLKHRKRSHTTFKTPLLPAELIDQYYLLGEQLGAACEAKIGADKEAGPHMSTAVVARDMLSIIDAIEGCKGKALLNYYGLSYGTYLGQTFASMYPDRVGRMVVDGVVDPDDYASGKGLHDVLLMDDAFATFFGDCHRAGPKLCPFYIGHSALDIQNRAEAIFAQLNITSAAISGKDVTIYITALRALKNFLANASYDPRTFWPYVAQQFLAYEQVLKNNSISLDSVQTISNMVPPSSDSSHMDWTLAVTCSELPLYGTNLTEAYLATLASESTLGVDYFAPLLAFCTRWPIKAKWIYSGLFGGKTKGKLLFVSNTLDPITPIVDSEIWYQKFSGAQFLSTDGAGHTSLNNPNSCTWSNIQTFFQMGQMNEGVKHCKEEAKYLPFTGVSSKF